MFKCFFPTVYYSSSYIVNFREIFDKGYRGLLMDVDNTIVPHGEESTEFAVIFFRTLHEIGWKTCIISNNDEPRVRPFADAVGSPYICNAGKPKVNAYIKGMELLGTDKSNTLFIGDQMFTDIFGANKTGIKSILVKPIRFDRLFLIRLKRLGEGIVKPFMFRYLKKNGSKL